jgi:hypothetical protein
MRPYGLILRVGHHAGSDRLPRRSCFVPDFIEDQRRLPATGSTYPMNPQPHHKWSSAAFGLAGLCLAALVLASVFDFATPALSRVLMAGIVISGTIAWVVQARQKCPHCGEPYGYGVRIVKAHLCRKCGGDFSG